MPFNAQEHMTLLRGKKYLEVKWRLVWFREEHPDWTISTEVLRFDERHALVKATITDAEGNVKQTGHKMETPKGFPDYLEKAETGAIGRALAGLGYGTQFAPELEEGERIVDAPVEQQGAQEQKPQSRRSQTPPPQPQPHPQNAGSQVPTTPQARLKALIKAGAEQGWTEEQVKAEIRRKGATKLNEITHPVYEAVRDAIAIAPPLDEEVTDDAQ